MHLHVVDKNRGVWKAGSCQGIKTRISIHTYLLSTETRCSISFWLQALELFSLLTVRVALSQAEANLLQELATQSLQDSEELQDDTGSAYSYGI